MKLSIITINRNNAEGLRRTLESTLGAQTGLDDWEQLVVDGASTDGSFSVLDKWKGDSHLGWHVSEPDSGIYNAMNKGVSHARGDYLLFLNSGDELLPNILERVFGNNFEEDIVYGDLEFVRKDDGTSAMRFPNPEEISPAWFLFSYLPHPASFISREYLAKAGGYDETYKIISDAKFFLDAVASGAARLRHLPFPVSRFHQDGMSSDDKYSARLISEKERMFSERFGILTARRVLFPPEGRAWILPEVAEASKKDARLAHFLLCSSLAISRVWHYKIARLLLSRLDVALSKLNKSLRIG